MTHKQNTREKRAWTFKSPMGGLIPRNLVPRCYNNHPLIRLRGGVTLREREYGCGYYNINPKNIQQLNNNGGK